MSAATATAGEPSSSSLPEQLILIPSLPNDVALNCLARIPRSHHPILSLVSKPIRSLLSSSANLLYATRSLLNSTQHFLYLCIGVPTSSRSSTQLFFTLNQTPLSQKYILTPIPSIPSPTLDGPAFAVVGPNIYVLGGSINDVPSQHVWVLDCRVNTWEKAPNMRVGRHCSVAVAIGGKIYVIGGCAVDTWARGRNWAEVFDVTTETWSPVGSKIEYYQKCMYASAVIDDMIYAKGVCRGVKFDPVNLSWESVESEIEMGWRARGCVVDGVLFSNDYLGKIRGFDVKRREWKELRGVEEGLPKLWWGTPMVNLGGKLVVVWEVSGGNGKEIGIWCAEIEVEKDEDGELWGEIEWSGLVLTVPNGSWILNCVAVTL